MQTSKRTMATNKGGGNARGGAGGGDAFTTMIMDERRQMASMRDCRQTGAPCLLAFEHMRRTGQADGFGGWLFRCS